MNALLQSHLLGHRELPELYPQRKVTFPVLAIIFSDPSHMDWDWKVSLTSMLGCDCLILHRSSTGYQSCYELMCPSAMSQLEASISQNSYSSLSSRHPFLLPTPLKLKSLFCMCGSFCRQLCLCTSCMPGALRGEKM